MNKKNTNPSISRSLRAKAEQQLIQNQVHPDLYPAISDDLKLYHELQVHQIELEMQNDELLQIQSDLDQSQKKISDILDFAPNSYFTLNTEGSILEVNFTGASLLGMNRSALVNTQFEKFIFHTDRPIFIQSQLNLIATKVHQVCELRITSHDGQRLNVRLDLSIVENKAKLQFLIIATDITLQKHIEDTQSFLLGNSWTKSGRDFFEELAEYLSITLQVDYVCIDRLINGSLEAQTVAIYFDGHFEDNVKYSLHDTPCGKVVGQLVCCFSKEVRLLFPKDKILQDMLAESYVGVTLWGTDGKPIGLIAVISRRPLKDTRSTELVLKQVSIRAVSELEHRQVEAELREREFFFRESQRAALIGSFKLDFTSRTWESSEVLDQIFGIDKSYIKNFKGWANILHPEDVHIMKAYLLKEIFPNQLPFDKECRIIRKSDTEVRWVHVIGKSNFDSDNNIISLVGTIHDITDRKLTEKALSENERLLRESQAVANIGSYAADLISKTWKASPEIYEIFGIDENYPRTLDGWAERIHPDFREELVNDLFQVQTERKLFDHEYKIIRLHDGAQRWIHGLGEFEYNDTQSPFRLIGTIQDITERKAKEKALYKLNRTLAALSKSSQAMLHSVNEDDYLQKVCKIVVEDTGFEMVWIGYAEDDAAKTVRTVASAGFIHDYLELIEVSWDDSKIGHGPTGTAIRTGKLCMCNNMLTDASFEPWREQAIQMGFASSVVFPLKSGEKTFGAISIYSGEPDSFLQDEISMLGELANDLAQGITTIRLKTANQIAEKALSESHRTLEVLVKERTSELQITNDLLEAEINIRKQKEQSLKAAEEKYRTVADYTYDWEYWINPEGIIQYMSPSVERITGFIEEDFIENPYLRDQIVFPDDQMLWEKHKSDASKTGFNEKHEDIEFRIITRSGDIRWIGHVCKRIYIDGKYLGIRVSNRDITEKVKAENELLNVTVKVEEYERNRISRELHDGLGPLLSTIKLYFQWLAETDNPSKIKIITDKGNQSIDRAIQTAREVSHGLNSHVLSTYGYVGAMFQFIQSINETRKLTIDFDPNSNERFSDLLKITLYRITTELINNTINYAEATHVEIEFNYNRDKKNITFTYKDDGIGFDMASIEKADKGIGLLNIKQRLKIVRGRVRFKSSLGKGVEVHIEIPLSETD